MMEKSLDLAQAFGETYPQESTQREYTSKLRALFQAARRAGFQDPPLTDFLLKDVTDIPWPTEITPTAQDEMRDLVDNKELPLEIAIAAQVMGDAESLSEVNNRMLSLLPYYASVSTELILALDETKLEGFETKLEAAATANSSLKTIINLYNKLSKAMPKNTDGDKGPIDTIKKFQQQFKTPHIVGYINGAIGLTDFINASAGQYMRKLTCNLQGNPDSVIDFIPKIMAIEYGRVRVLQLYEAIQQPSETPMN